MTRQPFDRIGIAGPLLGSHRGWVLSQGELLAATLRSQGVDVPVVSRYRPPYARALDTALRIAMWRRTVNALIIMVFSGRGFRLAELSVRCAGSKLPVVLWLHGGGLPEFAGRETKRVQRLLETASAIVAPSNFLARPFQTGSRTVEVIANQLPMPNYPYRLRRPPAARLLWMRTFHPIYNPQMAVRAFARLRDRHPEATLTMAGQDRGEVGATRKLAQELGVEHAVRFPGFLGPDEKLRALETHDIYLHTNQIDNTPVSVLEAAASGLLIAATRVGGIEDLLEDGRNALLVPADDHDAMANAIARLLEEPELAHRLSEAGPALAEPSRSSKVASQWLSLLSRVTRGAHS